MRLHFAESETYPELQSAYTDVQLQESAHYRFPVVWEVSNFPLCRLRKG